MTWIACVKVNHLDHACCHGDNWFTGFEALCDYHTACLAIICENKILLTSLTKFTATVTVMMKLSERIIFLFENYITID